jgi:stage II sporulation protein M
MWKKIKNILADNRKYILLSLLLLIFGALIGYIFKDLFHSYVQEVFKKMSSLVDDTNELKDPISLLTLILKNNVIAVISMIAIGLLSFGIYAIMSLVLNGAIVGYLLNLYADAGINPLTVFIIGLLPHGIFEFPAIILACAIGIRLGVFATQWLSGLLSGQKRDLVKVNFNHFLKDFPMYFGVVIFLLVIAAFVESFITPGLLQTFFTGDELNVIQNTIGQ